MGAAEQPPEEYLHRASFRVSASSSSRRDALCESLEVEAGDPLGGAHVRLVKDSGDSRVFAIEIEAVDLVHLRAATNSFLKWLQAADATLDSACR